MLFEDEAVTFAQFVLDQRLALACRRLRDPRYAGWTISAIAHGAGFGDLSWFNRAFRRRYSMTPTGARRRAPAKRPGRRATAVTVRTVREPGRLASGKTRRFVPPAPEV